ncbi:conserved hypothetical protein [Hyella patelloides LEGE 07179]|uniref:Thylakoid-associated protein n=1 Tax=Hyella patelloides LEGE 07179 TaxID=945734 RepID=A0A563VLG1_9CYAN|nr:DUF3181 family protein [Hyella patelloides]VEP12145.1 conserved hypothetical protein [Hyella patelloides LEGE 07179]
MASTAEIEALAAEIGENIYLDIAKWHLYLSDAHLHTPLAEKLYPLIEDDEISEAAVNKILESTTVQIGGGKKTLPLTDFLPMQCQVNLIDLLEEFQKNK